MLFRKRGSETHSIRLFALRPALILTFVVISLLIIGTIDLANVSAAPRQKVTTPTFIPAGGTYFSPQNVTIQCDTAGAIIRYSIVGSVPLTVYSGPIVVSVTTTVVAKAVMTGMTDSDTVSATYSIKVVSPTFSPAGGDYSAVQSVTIQTATAGATITYTTDGSEPISSSTAYLNPISLSSTTTLKAKAFMNGRADSDTSSATYNITLPVATPTFNPPGSTYSSPQNVALNCDTAGATIRYTIDGSEPISLSTAYSNPIFVGSTTTIKAKAFMNGMTDSNTAAAIYTIVAEPQPTRVSTPVLNPAGGPYSSIQTVRISCATSGAIVRYTLNGSEPSSSSALYSNPILISANTTVKAKAFAVGLTDSDTAVAVYAIVAVVEKVATPTIAPVEGLYAFSQSVTIECATSGAVIRYTTTGIQPSSSSAVYSGPILISAPTTIKAKAFMNGMVDSDAVSATYIISGDTTSQNSFFGNEVVFAAIAVAGIIVIVIGSLLYGKQRKR